MKLRNVVALCLISIAIVSSSITAFADAQLEAIETVNFSEEVTIVEVAEEIIPFAVSKSRSFSVNTGKNWYSTFAMKTIADENHNAFNTVVSDVSGPSYKMVVEGENGFLYISPEMTGDCTLTVTNTQADSKYTVYLVNVGSGIINGNVNISSYHN